MYTTCTAFLKDGITPCHKMAECVEVKVENSVGAMGVRRMVCEECCRRLKIPFEVGVAVTYRADRGLSRPVLRKKG